MRWPRPKACQLSQCGAGLVPLNPQHRRNTFSRGQPLVQPRVARVAIIGRASVATGTVGGGDDGGRQAGGGGNYGGGRRDNANSNHTGGDEVPPGRPVAKLFGAALLSYLGLQVCAATAWDVFLDAGEPKLDTQAATVSVIIPALNEERAIPETVRHALYGLCPQPCEVIVVDGGSEDGTAEAARRAGARIIRCGARGRGLQMNVGAAAARGDILLFLHADTRLPENAVTEIRAALAAPRTVLLGFRPLIEDKGRTLWFSTFNNAAKTWYGPMLLRPASFIRGLRCLFGDQALSCRATDFRAVGGFRSDVPIMEDAELCIAMHMAGPADKAQHQGRGRVRMLTHRPAVTSGRRIVSWGELRANLVFAYISLRWLAGASPQELHGVYRSTYRDVR